MIFPGIILAIAASLGSTAETKACETLDVTSQKINELYDLFLNTAPIQNTKDRTIYSTCHLQPNPKLNATEVKVKGQVWFKQAYPYGKLEALFYIEGFPLDANQSLRAIHIHDFGDLSNGCDSAGGHYNPFSAQHPNHPGDFGNFRVRNGRIQKYVPNLDASLFGPFSVFGRSVVVHKMADDLGKGKNKASLENGNAGARLACCVIGTTSKTSWDTAMAQGAKSKTAKESQRAK